LVLPKWYKDNVAFINNSSSFTATSPGTYKVEVQLTFQAVTTEEIKIEFAAAIVLNDASLSQCDGILTQYHQFSI
jgi:hypothetical protein